MPAIFKTIPTLSQQTRTPIDDDDDGNIDRIEFDTDGDGIIDRIAHLDAEGRWERVEWDLDDDGTIDRITHYAYDDDGNRTRAEVDTDADGLTDRTDFDDDADGNFDRSEAYTYNGDGSLIRTRFDDDADGNFDRSEIDFDADGNINQTRFDDDDDGTNDRTEFYTYNSDGSLIRTRFDDDADGTIDRSEAYTYNGDGNRTRTRFDDDADGNFDRTRFDFDADGNINQTRFDDDDDGTNDRIEFYTYNSDGSLIRTRFDDDADGNFDRTRFDFDADGNINQTRFDDDDDGTNDRTEFYTYNSEGSLIRTRFDDDADGNFDRTRFDFDADGNINQTRFDDDDDGTNDRTEFYTYNSDGGLIRTRFDDDADGLIDRTDFDDDADGTNDRSETYIYNGDGNRTRTRFDDDNDGTADRSEAYIYDGDGNRIRTRFDDDNDGNIDRIAFDDDGDGTPDRINHYTIDDDGTGRVIRRDSDLDDDDNIDRTVHLNAEGRWERVERDLDDDGTNDRIDHYAFAADGTRSLTRSAFDDDGDGIPDRSEAYSYDGDGNRTRTRFDDGNDGNIDRTDFDDDADGTTDRSEAYTYNSDGRVSQTSFDDDNDGTADRSETYIYNGDGNRTRTRFDDDNDGNFDRSEFDFDADGNINQTRFDDDDDGTNDRTEFYTYNSDGGLIRTRFDDDADGTNDRIEFYAYNSDGDLIRTRFDDDADGLTDRTDFDDDGDGRIDRSETYIYNTNGTLIRTDFDDDADGRIDRTTETGAPPISRVALSSLNGTNGFILTGIDAFDSSGSSVSSAGDVNGDGYDDLIIGAFRGDPNGYSSGETYVVYGGPNAPVDENGALDLSDLDGTNGFILTGIDAGDRSGFSVSSAGDVNGDGYDDLIIGAYRGDPNGYSSGETYIVYGGASAPGTEGELDLSSLNGTNGFTLTGIDVVDYSGRSVSSAGDVNGDGYDDLIIGAWGADPGGNSRAGETYIVYGGASAPGTDGVLDLGALDGTNGFTLTGVYAGDYSGRSVSSAGDVNGDGYDDLIIGANRADPNGSDSGETYIIYGGASAPGTGGVLDLFDLDGTNGFTLTGTDRFDQSGRSVSSAGDVNGDGYDDLIIGAQIERDTYIVYGGASAPGTNGVLDLGALNGTNGFTLRGGSSGDSPVSSAGDVNGDGYDDLIIGDINADPNGDRDAGETYIVYGGANAPGTGGRFNLSALDGTNGFILTGIDRFDESGFSVFSAGDVNGDGYDDLIIGAPEADPNGRNSGETYVIYGGATGTESLTPVTAQGTAAADNFTGNAGDDSFTAIATDDVVRGGAGNDRISVTALDFAAIDGGTGQDSLVLDGAGLALDLTGPGNAGVDSVELFDLSGTGANSLVLDALAVFDVTEERGGGVASLDVLGDADDRVELTQSVDRPFIRIGQEVEDGVTYIVYRTGNAQVRVETGVQVQIPVTTLPIFTSPATASARENQSAAYMAAAADADGDMLVYSLSGTDAARFTINPDTGEVRFRAAPDFEDPGDADGDNVYDIIVTAFDGLNRTDHNVAITVTDEYDLIPLSSLDGSNGFILTGIDAGDGSGFSVSSAGDVNGDGYDDLIIGARNADPNGELGAGETYLVYGGASAPGTDGVLDLSTLDGTNGFTLTGIDAFDYSGRSVSSAGDVNGDGYDDLIIGTRGADPNGGFSGETYVVYGGASAPGRDGELDLSMLDGTNGFILTGIDAGDRSGTSVSSAGDVNGDGYDDLIIGAYRADPNGDSNAGETYVVYGGASAPGTDGVLDLSILDGTNGFTLTGIDRNDISGFSVSSAGDVNGDGYDDLIIGAREADPDGVSNTGETYVIYGGANAPGTGGRFNLSTLNGSNGFILTGIDADDRSGVSVSSAGDVNGDGYDDLIIGAFRADPNGDSDAGETYIVYGGASAPGTGGVLDLSDLDGTNGFILTGIDAFDGSGRSVSSAGDVNGDGYDDLIIGANEASPNGDSEAGETYVIYGGASAPGTDGVLDLSDLDGTNGFILTGIDAGDQSGFSVSSVGDVNGDGYDDLIIGAEGADPFSAGETYLVYGGATGTESLVPVTASGTAAADNFTGNAGDDSFTAIATNDVVRGGAGDDMISVTALDFAAIDGGTGQDTLVLDGAGLALDLTGSGNAGVDSVELFDLSGTGANSLVLDAQAVFDVTEEREGGAASLDVLGDADDRVDLSGSNFALTGTAAEDGVTYNVYRDGNAEVRIEDGVTVTLAAAGAQSARFKTDPKTDIGIDPVADPRTDTRIDPGTDPGSGTIRLDNPLMNNDPWNNNLWGNDLWDGLWADGVKNLDQPVHVDEDAIFIPLSDPLSFGPLASGPLPGPWGDLMCWPGLESHPAMQNDLAMILPEMEIITAYMEGF